MVDRVDLEADALPSARFCRCGSFGSTWQVMMLTGARPSICFSRSRIGRRYASYFVRAPRMSSMARMTTASTPGSPTHCGVVELGEVAVRVVGVAARRGRRSRLPSAANDVPATRTRKVVAERIAVSRSRSGEPSRTKGP